MGLACAGPQRPQEQQRLPDPPGPQPQDWGRAPTRAPLHPRTHRLRPCRTPLLRPREKTPLRVQVAFHLRTPPTTAVFNHHRGRASCFRSQHHRRAVSRPVQEASITHLYSDEPLTPIRDQWATQKQHCCAIVSITPTRPRLKVVLPPKNPEPSPLTPVEHQVLSLVCRGYRDSHIAEILSMSESAVKNHVRSLFRKLSRRYRERRLPL